MSKFKVGSAISFVLIASLSCYFDPVYDANSNGTSEVVIMLENTSQIDVFRVTVSGTDMDSIRFHHLAGHDTINCYVPDGEERVFVIDGYVSEKLRYSSTIIVDISQTEACYSVTMKKIEIPIPDVPDSITAEIKSKNVVQLAWSEKQYADGYTLYRTTDTTTGGLPKHCDKPPYLDSSVEMGNLYYYCVAAYNTTGQSAKSSYISILVPVLFDDPPEKPEGVEAEALSASSIHISWEESDKTSQYYIYRIEGNGVPNILIDSTIETEYNDAGLTPNTTYTYAVSAVNNIGESPKSASAAATTLCPIPDVPENLSAKALSEATIEVSWDNVEFAASYIVFKSLYANDHYFIVDTVSDTSHVISGLKANTTYYFKVKALNASGTSDYSEVASAKTFEESNDPPDVPTGLTAQALSSSSIKIDWDNASGASSYNVYRSLTLSGVYAKIASTVNSEYTDTGLDAQTTYYYKASAENSAGESGLSSADSATTISFIETPTGLTAQALSTTSIKLDWNSVTGATGYKMYRSLSLNGTYTEVASPSANTCTDENLTSATTYYYKVSALKGADESAKSDAVPCATQGEVPETPTGLSVEAHSHSEIKITFNAVSNATGYNVYWSSSSTGNFELLSSIGSTTYTHSGLTPETEYFYKVSATNGAGESDLSEVDSATTLEETDPYAVIDYSKCNSCGRCTRDCPTGACYYDSQSGKYVIDPDLCIACGACVARCNQGAITIVQRIIRFIEGLFKK